MSDIKRLHTREVIYIYKIYFPESDKCYIGQTCDLKRRMETHLKADSLVGLAMRKHDSWVGQISVLHTCYSRDESNRVEIEEIRNFDSVSPNGYNLTHGGEGSGTGGTFTGCHHTDESRIKMRDSHLGIKRPDVGDALRGRKQSPEHIEKVRQAGIGRKHSHDTKKKMRESALKRTRRPFSDEAKKNMGKHCKGNKNPMCRPEVRIKVYHTLMKKIEARLPSEILDNLDKLDELKDVS